MPIQNSSNPANAILQNNTNMALQKIAELKIACETEKRNRQVKDQMIQILRDKNTELENKCTVFESEKAEKDTLIQLIDENLQSSNSVLQCACLLLVQY